MILFPLLIAITGVTALMWTPHAEKFDAVIENTTSEDLDLVCHSTATRMGWRNSYESRHSDSVKIQAGEVGTFTVDGTRFSLRDGVWLYHGRCSASGDSVSIRGDIFFSRGSDHDMPQCTAIQACKARYVMTATEILRNV